MNVLIERRGCLNCRGMEGVPGDGWREHGYFVFGETAVHISQLVKVRALVHNGTPITTAWRNLLQHLRNDLRWMAKHPDLATR